MSTCLPYFHIIFLRENFIQVISNSFEKYYNTWCVILYFKKPSDETGVKYTVDQSVSSLFFSYIFSKTDWTSTQLTHKRVIVKFNHHQQQHHHHDHYHNHLFNYVFA